MKPAARRARTKIRKPKFLSLRLELSPERTTQTSPTNYSTSCSHQKQLTLFPLHPENTIEEKVDIIIHDENMAYLFAGADGGTTSLMGLLNADTTSEEDESAAAALSPSLAYAAGAEEISEKRISDSVSVLFRSALKSREREASEAEEEEKWVCMSEVVEQKEEEVSSCETEPRCDARWRHGGVGGGLVLKLDYEEVINAWCDKGPLFIEAECAQPQTVPDFYDDFLFHDLRSKQGGLWTVPEKSFSAMEDELAGERRKRCEMGHREASVMRYKEKRQSRLFAKRIRYEVRKLNAERRPRIKGRFVKRNEV
ncbi:hypothetical protein Dimus_013634 [Dionaea muscipula]